MKTRRILAILMIIVLLFTVSACRKQNTESADSRYTESDIWGDNGNSESQDSRTDSAAESTASGQASGGNTSSKTNGFSSGAVTGNVISDSRKIPGLPALSSKVKNKTVKYLTHVNASGTDKSVTKRYLPQYDMTVEYITVPYENKRTKLIQMISAGNAPDLISVDEQYLTLISNNLVQPVESYVDFSDKIWDSVRSLQNARKVKGKTYEIIQHASPSRMLFFNAKLFKNAAEKDPLYYYQKGQWDWNKLVELAKKMTKDQNNDGITDQWGFGGESLQFMLMGSVNEAFVKVDANGKVTNNLRSEKLASAMNMFKDLQTTYKIWPSSPSFDQIVNGKLAMGYFGIWNITTVANAEKMWKSGELQYVPAPSAPGMKNYNFPLYESAFIPVGAKNPHGAAAFMTYLKYAEATEENTNPKNMQKIYNDVCNNLMTAATNRDFDFASSLEWGICGDLVNGKSWSTIVEEYSPQLDASIAQLPQVK